MSRITSKRSRVALLATSSLMATGLAAGLGGLAVVAPSVALAANECGNPATNGGAADPFVCPAGTYATGIIYPTTAGDLSLNLNEDASGAVKTTTGGIQVTGAAGDTVTIVRSASVTGTGDPTITNLAGAGIIVTSPDSDVLVDLSDPDTGDTPIAVSGSTAGIIVSGGGSSASVVMTNGTVNAVNLGVTVVNTGTGSASISLGDADVTVTNPAGGAIGVAAVANGPAGAASVIGTAGGSVTVSASAGAIGIAATSAGSGTVTINYLGPVDVTATNAFGVVGASNSGDVSITTGPVTLTVTGNAAAVAGITSGNVFIDAGSISANTGNAVGVLATGGASVTVTTDDVAAASTGILALSGGDVNVTATGAVSSATDDAIVATSTGGDVNVTTTAAGDLTAANNGIKAQMTGAGAGDVTVTANGDIGTTGTPVAGNAISAMITNPAATGAVSVAVGPGASLNSVGSAVLATNAGLGDGSFATNGVTVTTAAGSVLNSTGGSHAIDAEITNAANANGVFVSVGGSITGLTGSGDGVRASTVGLGGVTVTTLAGSNVVGGDDAIEADINNAANTQALTVTANGVLDPNASSGVGYGVYANNAGSGATTVTLGSTGQVTGRALEGLVANGNGTGAVTIINNGAVGSAADPVDDIGIIANINNAGSAAALTVGGTGSVNAVNTGIRARNDGTGTTTVTGGAIKAGTGIDVESNGVFSITAGGNITATNNAILVDGANGGSVNVASGVTVIGKGSPATAVIDITTPAGKAVTLNNAGTIRSSNPSVTAAAGDTAVKVTGAALTVNNSGRLDGLIDYTAATAPAKFNNNAGGSWHIAGTQTLTAGNDTINNNAGALFATQGSTTLDFDGDTGVAPRDVFNNAGTVIAGETTGASTLTITGLETFTNNTGTIFFGSLNGGVSSDGQTNDRIVMTGTGGGTTFTGVGSSLLVFDANLGVLTQTSCAAAVVADCLNLPGGTFAGTNRLRVNDTATLPSGFNTTGIVLVDAGSVAAGSFTLDPGSTNYTTRGGIGAIDTGLFFYRLVPQGAGKIALISAPDQEVFEFTTLGMAANDIWYTTTGGWFDRESDLRDGLSGMSAGNHPGVWIKMVGDWTRRRLSQSFDSAGTIFTFDTSYQQDTAALVGGVDLLNGGGSSSAWVLGIDGGYVDANIRYRASPTRADITGTVLGVYATYLSGPWYVDVTAAANYLTLKEHSTTLAPLPGTAPPFSSRARVRSVGGQVETGWRWPVGPTLTLEPFGSLSYVRSRIHDLPVPGGFVDFDDANSFRGSLGMRVSSTMTFPTFRIKPTLYARVWDEWRGRDNIALINPGATVFATDRFRGVFGDVGSQVAFFANNGFTGFFDAGYKWKSRYRDYNARVGLAYRW